MSKRLRVLNIEDSKRDAALLRRHLSRAGYELDFERVDTREEMKTALEMKEWDVILADYAMPQFSALKALELLKEMELDIPFIIVSGTVGEELAVEAMLAGARDYLMKGHLARLIPAIERELHEAEIHRARRRAEKALRASEAELRALFAAMTDVILVFDRQGRYLKIAPTDPSFLYQRGINLIGKTLHEVFPEKDADFFLEQIRIALDEGRMHRVEYKLLIEDKEFWFEGAVSPMSSDSVVWVAHDITKRKQSVERIREQASLLDVTRDAIYVRDLNGRILFWNKSAGKLYGWSAEEVVGKDVHELLYKEDLSEPIEARRVALEEGQWTGELHQKNRAADPISVESRWTLVCDDAGKPQSLLVVNRDIREKKKLEAQFLRAQRMENIGALAGGIAHDLNNVLAPILMATQMLKRKYPDEYGQKLLDTLQTTAQRGADLVKQVLSFARGLEGERTILQLKHLILEMQKMMAQTFPRSIEVLFNPSKDLWTISGDATQLHQILMNLCVNARDAMPNGGTINISTENFLVDDNYAQMNAEAKPGPYIVVSVSDTGMGIPRNILDKIFDPFFTTKELGKGTGLGLSTVWGIVKNHGGFIHVNSEVGSGTQFKIYLPALETAEIAQAREALCEFPMGQGELILIVDDEASIREITKVSLEAFGYRVMAASEGTEAVALYAVHKDEIRLVLTDMMMPVMDGTSTIRALRRMDPNVKIIAVTGLAPKDREAEIRKLEIEAFLLKPYTAEALLRLMHEVLSRN